MNTTRDDQPTGRFGLFVTTAMSLGIGVVCGMVVGELLGVVHSDRVRRVIGRSADDAEEGARAPEHVERDVLSALRGNARTRGLDLSARTLGDGLVELTGTAPDEQARELAGRLARRVPGTDVVVNRILVEGVDTNDQPAASITSAT